MKRQNREVLLGQLTCPHCHYKQSMPIPNDRCISFYRCGGCKKMISAKKSCCVFCDYGDKKCPVGAALH
ncbi:hypothetical protein HZB03_03830 [Candidatus Woesearchaeota archaeon]|nr:hypothetical protein [Candidatus Woesearchaeota archaeon]